MRLIPAQSALLRGDALRLCCAGITARAEMIHHEGFDFGLLLLVTSLGEAREVTDAYEVYHGASQFQEQPLKLEPMSK